MPKPRDIKNMRFNNLVAIEKAKSRGGHTYWRFRCDCGNEKEIQMSGVTTGAVKSCGCLLESIRDMSIPLDMTNDEKPRTCKICENEFFGFTGDTRVFCYDCSPRGASVADAHRVQKRSMKHILVEYKGGKCVECGYDQCEGSLQFHHLNEDDKDFTLSAIKPNKISMNELRAEADKCVLLCANCHAKKHEVVDKVAVIMNLANQNERNYGIRRCKVCDSEFVSNIPYRGYCYNCSPPGLSAKDAMRTKKRAIKHELLKYKGAVCMACGYDEYEGALQLHHRNPADKEFTFSDTNLNDTDFTMDRMRKEADKCDVLCANCHFEVHYKNDDDIDES